MTLTFKESEWDKLDQAPAICPNYQSLDDFALLTGVPAGMGNGYSCDMTITPGVWLNFHDVNYHQDLMIKVPPHDHPIQIFILLSGFIYYETVYPNFGGTRSYFSGSGISPAYEVKHRGGEHLSVVNIEIEPNWLDTFLVGGPWCSDNLQQLFRGKDWKRAFYPTVTPMMRLLSHQLWNAPYKGPAKRLYLQAKVFELLALHLDLLSEPDSQSIVGLKSDTITRLYHAQSILSTQLEHPPLLSELAVKVGVSASTLQRGFQELFGTTVFGYLRELRLEQAKELLLSREMQVSQVAHTVGYSHLGHFTKAFKRKFGITPKQYQMGQR